MSPVKFNPGAGIAAVPPVTGTQFTISNTGVLSVNGETGDVTVGGGSGLVKLFDNTPDGQNMPGGVQGIFAFDTPTDGVYHTVIAGFMIQVFAGPITCKVGWSTQAGLLPQFANLVLFDLEDVPTDAWILGNAGGVLLPGNGGQMNVNLLEGSGGGAQIYAQVFCTP
jgi:hypothetical protein